SDGQRELEGPARPRRRHLRRARERARAERARRRRERRHAADDRRQHAAARGADLRLRPRHLRQIHHGALHRAASSGAALREFARAPTSDAPRCRSRESCAKALNRVHSRPFLSATTMFEAVGARYDGPELEKDILELWRRENVFGRIMAEGASRPHFVFYEGPPTANGRPGIHHVLARTFKDLYPRYKTMRGFHCPRKAGWDTHGLPVEHEIEKELGIFDKKVIEEKVGIQKFTDMCRSSVMRHVAEWEAMTERMGFWVSFKDAYFTLHNKYIESVWSLLETIWKKGLIYQGYKVVPYDPRIGATLSSHEVAQGYREVDDPSVFVRFKAAGEPSTFFLVWTTTPWTLPSNLLLAVYPDVEYVWVKREGETLILATDL